MKVTPWEVSGDIDYDALIEQFGVKPLSDKQIARIEKLAGESHFMIRRGVFFAHTYLDDWLAALEKGETVYLYTGRAPSGHVHLGHMLPWIFTRWLQEKLKVHLVFQIPDEEKFLFKDLTLEDTDALLEENVFDVIAAGFDPELTTILIDTRDAQLFYRTAMRVAQKTTASQAKALFGLTDSHNIGAFFYSSMQSVPAFVPSMFEGRPTRVLIPCAIDQDVHFRLTRDVALRLGYPKPSTLLCRFLPGLGGEGKLSSSENVSITFSDTPAQVKRKINKYAFSGGKDTVEEHRASGGDPSIDVSFRYLSMMFEPDDAKLERIASEYRSGALLSGELKAMLIERVNAMIAEHAQRRKRAPALVDRFLFDPSRYPRLSWSFPTRNKASKR
ncbi:MAG: tryptophan--tRNA ligase [Candidatus Woesearchaeota archaeon]